MKDYQKLSDRELLNELLNDSAAAEALLQNFGTIRGISQASDERMKQIPLGLYGCARGFELLRAAAEFGRRTFVTKTPRKVTDAQSAARILVPKLGQLQTEQCWVLFLGRNNGVLATEQMTSGGTDAVVIDKKVILRRAVDLNAAGIILAHNHPSGKLEPSRADCKMTGELRDAANIVGILLLDHLIIAGNGYYSFSDEKASELA